MPSKSYLKRGIQFILHGTPVKQVYAQVTYLAPNEILCDRTAIITGRISGIGYEIAKAYYHWRYDLHDGWLGSSHLR